MASSTVRTVREKFTATTAKSVSYYIDIRAVGRFRTCKGPGPSKVQVHQVQRSPASRKGQLSGDQSCTASTPRGYHRCDNRRRRGGYALAWNRASWTPASIGAGGTQADASSFHRYQSPPKAAMLAPGARRCLRREPFRCRTPRRRRCAAVGRQSRMAQAEVGFLVTRARNPQPKPILRMDEQVRLSRAPIRRAASPSILSGDEAARERGATGLTARRTSPEAKQAHRSRYIRNRTGGAR